MLCIRGAGMAALLALAVWTPVAAAHGGGNLDYSSQIRSIDPAVDGLRVEILDRDDRLLLINDTGRRAVVLGYDDEPYVRIDANGAVYVNARSPAHYLNQERDGDVDVPESADDRSAPRWRLDNRSGRYEWHDHRIHWMGGARPGMVRDPERRTKVFDWSVPVRVGARPVAIDGTLWWVGRDEAGPPLGALIALVAVLVGSAVFVIAVRHRRRGSRPEAAGGDPW